MSVSKLEAPQFWKALFQSRARLLWPIAQKSWHRIDWLYRRARKYRCGVEWVRNIAIDYKYRGYCGGRTLTRFAEAGAHATTGTDYNQLKKLFSERGVPIRPDDVLVDVGCGKGRVINFWLHSGHKNRMYGLELDPEFAAWTAQRLSSFPNVSILAGDAVENLPQDATLLYLFSPFKAYVVKKLKEQLEDRCRDHLDRVRILYYSDPKKADVFRQDPAWEVKDLRHLKTFYDAVLITRKTKAASAANGGGR